jgi:putative hydrolase of the HAD superfamily
MRIGVLTNGNHDQQIDKLRATGLAPLINVVCVSDEIGRAKPDRRAFKILAERLETPVERIAFVGDDREHDIDGARSAGMRAGLVDRAGPPPIGLEAALRIARPRSPGENGDEKDASSPRS